MPDHETTLTGSAWLQNLLFEDKVAKLKEHFSELSHAEISQMLTAADGIYDSAYALLHQRMKELQEQVRGCQVLNYVYASKRFHTMHSSTICMSAVLMRINIAMHSRLQPSHDASPALCCDAACIVGMALLSFRVFVSVDTTSELCLPSLAASHLKVCKFAGCSKASCRGQGSCFCFEA